MSIVIHKNGLQKLGEVVFKVNKPLIGKRGIHYQKLLKDWQQIVGKRVGNLTIPVKISSIKHSNKLENILHIATNNASSAVEMSYHIGLIKEQVNIYFGYAYVQQVKLTQAVFLTKNIPEYQEKLFSEDEITKACQLTQDYKSDDSIKDILVEFAKNIAQKYGYTNRHL